MAVVVAQNNGQVTTKQQELGELRETIKKSETKLKQLEKRARQSRQAMEESRLQSKALDSLVGRLRIEEEAIARDMIDIRSQRDSLDDEMALMTEEYIRIARSLFRQRLLTPPASMLLLPEEHRKLALREKMFERYTVRQQERARDIVAMTVRLEQQDSTLASRRREQVMVIADKRAQMEKLISLQKRYAKSATKAESESEALRTFLARKNSEAVQIEGMITRLISEQNKLAATRAKRKKADEARAKLKSRKSSSSSNKASSSPSSARSQTRVETSSRSGSINFGWPVGGKNIVQGYGERKNPRTNTVTLNPGVNIAAAKGSSVKAAESGIVSLVSWLPSYGTVVIVEHASRYRTVYANLASASVSKGTEVRKGTKLGVVGESIEGEFLHFEVWRGQERLNPATLLH